MLDEGTFGAGLSGEVEVLERLGRGEPGGADPGARSGRFAREDFGFAERFEELLIGPALRAGPFSGGVQAFQDPWCLQGPQQVGQSIAVGHAQSSA
jgi:hypothetical protein